MAENERDLTLSDDEHVLALVQKLVPTNLSDVRQVRSFAALRSVSDGRQQQVRLHLHDAGEAVHHRYLVSAVADGKTARGRAAPTLSGALGSVQWGDLD
jgi:hypothetical protein